MIDPIYNYHPGQGWLPTIPNMVKLNDCTIMVESRVPKIGEHYTYFGRKDDYYLDEDGNLKLDVFASEFGYQNLHNFSTCDETDHEYWLGNGYISDDLESNGMRCFATLVPLK
jgi:hypothetical protein